MEVAVQFFVLCTVSGIWTIYVLVIHGILKIPLVKFLATKPYIDRNSCRKTGNKKPNLEPG